MLITTFAFSSLVGCSCSNKTEKLNGATIVGDTSVTTVDTSNTTTNLSADKDTNVETNNNSSENTTKDNSSETPMSEDTTQENTSEIAKPVETTESTTSKPVETTTAKPTSKPTEETTTKPMEETTTKPSSSSSTWEPEYYTANDKVGDGLDEYRIGLQKYSANGTQLYVKTNYTDRHNGYYTVCEYLDIGIDEELSKKHEAFKKAFEEKYNPPAYTNIYYSTDVYIGDENDNTLYYMQSWEVGFHGGQTVSGEVVEVYDWDEGELINIYGSVMSWFESGASIKYGNFTTLEEVIKSMGFTIEQYNEGEKLAKKYGIDFHGDIEYYKEMAK